MRWKTTVWISAALVVVTSAQHLTIENELLLENDLLQDHTTPTGHKVGENNDVITVGGSEEVIDSDESESVEIPNSNEQTNSSQSVENLSPSIETEDGSLETPIPSDPSSVQTESAPTITPQETTTAGVTNGDNEGEVPPEGGEENGPENENITEAESIEDNMMVETTSGPVRGHVWRDNANIISYIDIKYGTFKSLFEAPVFPDPSETIHEVKEHNKRCPQLQDGQLVGDTDCLTLSIFKSSDASSASVLVHIHEGNFSYGSANPAIYGPEYLVSKGIILVLPNYRLGPLGFLCLQDETAPGNAALKDLTLALSWIKTNIGKFGGNPENIAVSGEGTAGSLAGYLAISPVSKPYISKVITESGSVLSHWALDRNPVITATKIANNIDGFESWQDVETLVLMKAAKDIDLRPCVEKNIDNGKHFMVQTPWTMLEELETNIMFMIGSAKYAGIHEFLQHTEDSIQRLNEDVGLLLPNDLRFQNSAERNSAGNKVKNLYFGDDAITVNNVEQLTLYCTDASYLGPGIRTARPLVDSGATVFMYEFSFVGSFNRELTAIERPVEGAVRGDIIGYLFTQDGVVPGDNTKESLMVDKLIELWTSFLNTGTPSTENIKWNQFEKVNDSEEQWLSIDTALSLEQGVHVERLSLWTDIYEQHYIERNLSFVISPSVYSVLILQCIFFISFFRNAPHLF